MIKIKPKPKMIQKYKPLFKSMMLFCTNKWIFRDFSIKKSSRIRRKSGIVRKSIR